MSRQILTFVIVFIGIMLVMRSCPTGPPDTALLAEKVEEADDTVDLGPVTLAQDGSIVTIAGNKRPIVRTVPAERRGLRFLVQLRGKKGSVVAPPDDSWGSSPVDGGHLFHCDWEGLRIEKTVRLVENGLDVDLTVTGTHPDVKDHLLTVGSGVPLAAGEDPPPAYGLWQIGERKAEKRPFRQLVQSRKAHRDEVSAVQKRLGTEDRVRHFGVLGAEYFVGFVDLPPVPPTNRLFLDVYRAHRDGTQTDEIEAWVTLVPREAGTTFRYRWRPRAEMVDTLGLRQTAREPSVYTLENETIKAVFIDRGAAIRGMWLKEFAQEAGEELEEETWIPILRDSAPQGEFPLTLQLMEPEVDTADEVWELVEQTDQSIRFRIETADKWSITKTVTLPEPGAYDLSVDIEIVRPSDSGKNRRFRLVGPAGSYLEDAFRGTFAAAPPAGFVLERPGGSDENEPLPNLAEGDEIVQTYSGVREGQFLAVGARGAYFTVALVSPDDRNRVTQAVVTGMKLTQELERGDGEKSRDSILGRVSCQPVFEGSRAQESFRLYAGPNRRETLRELGIEDAVDFGWFAPIGRFLMWLMKVLQGAVGSYGVAIILMTLFVRACLLPVSYRTQLGMQRYSRKLQKIKPILDELQKKYANNTQKMNQERMKVMREHNIGFPLGCLMILFQFPIWISLFTALRVEFSLRHQSFLWAEDLSLPDRLFGLPFWPHWFNLFPIVMLVLWTLQQRLTPTPAGDDPQVKMQMKMMKFMPFLFFFMLYNYASALAVYMCMSSLWSIAESKLVRRAIAKLD
ncbi:MAG: YidC/Oxa1 family insertase periplasmic-domain containing protein [Planctomycetota bacterium]|jgi:YidC/Oxa1 family membrane protein insertase